MSLDFSETYKRTGPPPCFSPDGQKIATAVDHRLVLRDAETCAVICMQECVDKIQHIEWSHDSDHVLCAVYRKGKVQVFKFSDDEWKALIDEGPAGIAFAKWAPCGTKILCVTEFNLRVSVWSLIDTSCVYIKSPKFCDGRGLDFSPDGKFLSFVERKQCVDSILIIDCATWTTASNFAINMDNVSDAQWSPDSTSISVTGSENAEGVLVLYSPDGRVLREYKPAEDDSKVRSSMDASSTAYTGTRCQKWSSSGSFLAAGCRDRKCRVLNHVSWRAFAELAHDDRVVAPATVAVYEETEERLNGIGTLDKKENVLRNNGNVDPDSEWYDDVWDGDAEGTAVKDPVRVAQRRKKDLQDGKLVPKYVVKSLPASIPFTGDGASKSPEPSLQSTGVKQCEWSFNDRFLATLDAKTSKAVYVWDMVNIELCSVLVQMDPVVEFKWDPRGNRLAVITNSERVYVWSPNGASFVQIPLPQFTPKTLTWNPEGGSFALGDKGTFCVAFLGDT